MKKISIALLILFVACTKTVSSDISEFLHTRSDAPLENTIWEHETDGDYNRYLVFSEGNAGLFYGLTEGGELQRWSEIYQAPYTFVDGKVITSIEYPFYASKELVNRVNVVKAMAGYEIEAEGERYTYYGNDLDEIEGQWMIITVNITPWSLQ